MTGSRFVLFENIVDGLGEAVNMTDADMKKIEGFLDTLPEKALRFGIRVLIAVVLFVVGLKLISLLRRVVRNGIKKGSVETGVIQFLDSLMKIVLYILLIIAIASGFGFDAASVIALIGSAGITAGLALQGSLSNFAGGVLILLQKPFVVGDYIQEDTHKNEGTVTEIRLFYTKLLTSDGRVIVLPNGALSNTSLTNVTMTPKRRLELCVYLSYAADTIEAKRILEELLQQDEDVLKEYGITVCVDSLALQYVTMKALCFTQNETYFAVKWRLTEAVKLRFEKAGLWKGHECENRRFHGLN